MKKLVTCLTGILLLGGMFCFPVCAAESGDPSRSKHGRLRLTEITVTGKMVRIMGTDKDGNLRASFVVITPVGEKTWIFTGNRAEDGQPTSSQLEKFRDKVITVVGKGYTADENNGQTVTHIISVTRILLVDPDAGK